MRKRSDIQQQEKSKMLLSRETLEGIRITGKQIFITFNHVHNYAINVQSIRLLRW